MYCCFQIQLEWEVTDWAAFPYATCEADYCGGCNAKFYQNSKFLNNECDEPEACLQEFKGSGDVTQNGEVDVLDIILIIDIILNTADNLYFINGMIY